MKKVVDLLCISCDTVLGREERDVPASVVAVKTQRVCGKCLTSLQTALVSKRGKYIPRFRNEKTAKPVKVDVKIAETLLEKEKTGDFGQDEDVLVFSEPFAGEQ